MENFCSTSSKILLGHSFLQQQALSLSTSIYLLPYIFLTSHTHTYKTRKSCWDFNAFLMNYSKVHFGHEIIIHTMHPYSIALLLLLPFSHCLTRHDSIPKGKLGGGGYTHLLMAIIYILQEKALEPCVCVCVAFVYWRRLCLKHSTFTTTTITPLQMPLLSQTFFFKFYCWRKQAWCNTHWNQPNAIMLLPRITYLGQNESFVCVWMCPYSGVFSFLERICYVYVMKTTAAAVSRLFNG